MNTRTEAFSSSHATSSLNRESRAPRLHPHYAEQMPTSARLVLELLKNIKHGQIVLTLPNGKVHVCGTNTQEASLDMQIHDWKVFNQIIDRGDIGAAEAYIDGHWDTHSLPQLLTLIGKNRSVLKQAIHGQRFKLMGEWLLHRLRANTRRGSRRNIMAHYDLGNSFYELWLDSTMMYSSALFKNHSNPYDAQLSDLPNAQIAKNDRIISALNLQPNDHILEVGCGWGGFAEQAVAKGAQITGLTLSPAQRDFALNRASAGGWASQAEFLLTDYRDMEGQFDHIVSIEMFEAVGQRWWPTYFKTLKRLLKPGGRAVIQVITIDDDLFDQYRRNTDFIQRHVFPGGMLPSPQAFCQQAQRAGFYVADALPFGQHYAQTLALWHQAFDQQADTVRQQGFDERFMRLWRFYLAYCEAGFRSESTNVYQYTLQS